MKPNSKDVASCFFTEMAEWERWNLSIERDEDSAPIRRKKLEIIFKKYLSKKALGKGQSRLQILMFGEPPEYELDVTKIEDVSDDKHHVYAKGSGWEPEKRYVCITEAGEWRVEYREYFDDVGKWVKEGEL